MVGGAVDRGLVVGPAHRSRRGRELWPSLHTEELLHGFWPGVYPGIWGETPDQNQFSGVRIFYLTITFVRRLTASGGDKPGKLRLSVSA